MVLIWPDCPWKNWQGTSFSFRKSYIRLLKKIRLSLSPQEIQINFTFFLTASGSGTSSSGFLEFGAAENGPIQANVSRCPNPKLNVCPPPIEEPFLDIVMGNGCVEKSEALAQYLAPVAERNGCHFFDARGCEFNNVDHMHLSRRGHAQLAEKLAALVPTLV